MNALPRESPRRLLHCILAHALFAAAPSAGAQVGTPDSTYTLSANNIVRSLTTYPDGSILACGDFTSIGSVPTRWIAKLTGHGQPDPGFVLSTADADFGTIETVQSAFPLPDGSVGIVCSFTPQEAPSGTYVIRSHDDGSLDTFFPPFKVADTGAQILGVQPSGHLVIATGNQLGAFARLSPDGAVDLNFANRFALNHKIQTSFLDPQGRIIASKIRTPSEFALTRYSTNGEPDPAWIGVTTDAPVTALSTTANGHITISGAFTTIDSVPARVAAVLAADGSLPPVPIIYPDRPYRIGDQSYSIDYFTRFQTAPDGTIYSLGVVAFSAKTYVFRLGNDLSPSTAFTPYSTQDTDHFALTAGGRILVPATNWAGPENPTHLARLLTRPYRLEPPLSPIAVPRSPHHVRLEWQPQEFADAYVIERSAGNTPDLWQTVALVLSGPPTWTDTTAAPEMHYHYRVATVNEAGNSAPSPPVSAAGLHPRLSRSGQLDKRFSPLLWNHQTTTGIPTIDGGYLLQGAFEFIDGVRKPHLARILPDGSLDPGFPAAGAPDQTWFGIVEDQLGRLYVNGQPPQFGGSQLNQMNRLLADGSLDPTFSLPLTFPFNSIRAALPTPGGKLLIGGTFETVGGIPVPGLLRINGDGSVDPTFTPQESATFRGKVSSLAIDSQGRLLAGIDGARFSNAARPPRIVRFLPDGSIDPSFNLEQSPSSRAVHGLVVGPAGEITFWGSFTSFDGDSSIRYLGRLTEDGSRDNSFAPPGFGGVVVQCQLAPDGRTAVRFEGTQIDTDASSNVVILLQDGSPDPAFQIPAVPDRFQLMNLKPDGSIELGGPDPTAPPGTDHRFHLTAISPAQPPNSIASYYLTTISNDVGGHALLPGGDILVAGDFTLAGRIDGGSAPLTTPGLAMLRPDGTLSPDFSPPTLSGGSATTVALQAPDHYLIGGNFTSVDGSPSVFLARLKPDFSFDPSFVSPVIEQSSNEPPVILIGNPDGSAWLGTSFLRLRGASSAGNSLHLLDGSGTPVFTHRNSSPLTGVTVGSDQHLLVPGRRSLSSIAPDGSYNFKDRSLREFSEISAVTEGEAGTLIVAADSNQSQQDGIYQLDGDATAVLRTIGQDGYYPNVFQLLLLDDGSLLAAGDLTHWGGVPHRKLVRLTPEGRLDPQFDPRWGNVAGTDEVRRMEATDDRLVIVSGHFGVIDGSPAPGIAKIHFGAPPLTPEIRPILAGADGHPVVAWIGHSDADRLQIERSLSPSEPASWITIANLDSARSGTFTDLQIQLQVPPSPSYRITAFSGSVPSTTTPGRSPGGFTTPPTAPGSLSGTATSPSSVALDWAPSQGATTYLVERDPVPGESGFTVIATVAAPETGYIDYLAFGNTYNYRVTAVNQNGASPPSHASPVSVPDDTGDVDGDGLGAVAELAFGLDPFFSDSLPISANFIDDGTRVSVSILGLHPTFSYHIEHSPDLQEWTMLDTRLLDTTPRAVLAAEKPGMGNGFYRLRAEVLPLE